jgi:hypothetical protein
VGVLAIAGGVLAAYCLSRRKRKTPTANVAHVEQQGAQPPAYFATAPVTAEKVGYQTAVTEVNSPLQQPTLQAQSGIPVPVQANEKLVVPPTGQQSYSPQQAAAVVSGVSPVSPYQVAASPQPQPNAYEVPGNMSAQQSTIAQPQFSQVYEAPSAPPQHAPQSPPPTTNAVYEVPTNTPGVTGASELPASQS